MEELRRVESKLSNRSLTKRLPLRSMFLSHGLGSLGIAFRSALKGLPMVCGHGTVIKAVFGLRILWRKKKIKGKG